MFTMDKKHAIKAPRFWVVLATGLRILLGAVFLWASWNKLWNPDEFALIIQNYQILPFPLIYPAALILPWVEIVCGSMLVMGFYVKGSVFIIDLLLATFIAAYLSTLLRGIDVACGCFSASLQAGTSAYVVILRDLSLLGVGVTVLVYQMKYNQK